MTLGWWWIQRMNEWSAGRQQQENKRMKNTSEWGKGEWERMKKVLMSLGIVKWCIDSTSEVTRSRMNETMKWREIQMVRGWFTTCMLYGTFFFNLNRFISVPILIRLNNALKFNLYPAQSQIRHREPPPRCNRKKSLNALHSHSNSALESLVELSQ